MPELRVRPLDAVAFRPFGQVVEAAGPSRPANDGRAQRFPALCAPTHEVSAARPELSIYRVQASRLPLRVEYLERHPLTSQLFVPTRGGRYLVVVAGSDATGAPDASRLAAFVAGPEQGICYAPGTWHYPIVALDVTADFLMLMWEAPSDADNCEARQLATPCEVVG